MNSKTNIFLVDDDEMDQEFFISALSFIDNVKLVKIAKNGMEALAALKQRRRYVKGAAWPNVSQNKSK